MNTRSAVGDGPQCPEEGDHGRTYAVRMGWWCPVSQTIFKRAADGHSLGEVWRLGDHVEQEPAK